MSWLDAVAPARMRRVAIVAPEDALPSVLAQVADAGLVEIGSASGEPPAGQAQPAQAPPAQAVPGPAQLNGYVAAAMRRSGAAALAGWMPASDVAALSARLAGCGGAVVPLANPPGADPPTLLTGRPMRRKLTPLVQTYGTVPYSDLDPSWLAWGSYVLMFGMMFGDAGEGMILLLAALALRIGWLRWTRRFQQVWPFAVGAGAASTGFGLLYGECFGPTGLVPTIWLDPLDHPVGLLFTGAGVGAVLIAGAYLLGVINRWREGGWRAALYAPSGIAGSCLFGGAALVAGWRYAGSAALLAGGGVLAVAGLALAWTGFLAAAGGGGAGLMQAAVELFDLVVRLGSNVVSFTRLAAFGLTHAALGLLVWESTRGLWHRGGVSAGLAVVLFIAGTALAFGMEALVAAIQALRLEYYELFSRLFVTLGRPFRPWHLPLAGAGVGAGQGGSPAAEEIKEGKP
jgi:V/A-type H+/Na+-transporting ATPase subunit I